MIVMIVIIVNCHSEIQNPKEWSQLVYNKIYILLYTNCGLFSPLETLNDNHDNDNDDNDNGRDVCLFLNIFDSFRPCFLTFSYPYGKG